MTLQRPVSLGFLALNAAWSAAMLAAPFMVVPGSARHLDGLVNATDHAELWASFPPLARVTYGLGDLVCHQMESRSLLAHGNEFPVDARLLSMFLAANIGFLLVRALPARPSARAVVAIVLPNLSPQRRRWAMPTLLASGLAPTAVDGTLQLLTSYESTNVVRVFTGAWMGLGTAIWLAVSVDALAASDSAAPARDHAGG